MLLTLLLLQLLQLFTLQSLALLQVYYLGFLVEPLLRYLLLYLLLREPFPLDFSFDSHSRLRRLLQLQ